MSWVDIQHKTFLGWCNDHLRDRGIQIKDLKTDLSDGVNLINLLEIISGKSIGRYNKHPRIPTQQYENTGIAMKFLQDEGVKMVNIGNTDITDGNYRIILGLIWTIILRYQINKNGSVDDLLAWVKSKIPEYGEPSWKGSFWNDGKALCGLTNAVGANLCPNHQSLDPNDKVNNLDKGMKLACDRLGIPRILEPKDMAHPKVDSKSLQTYISYFRNAELLPAANMADQCTAYGPGLTEGVVDEDAPFTVETPAGAGKLEIVVEGPKDKAKVDVKKLAGGGPGGGDKYEVTYKPTEPGEYKVHVTLDGTHIPGSTFHVTVLKAVSLGGEGKIRVYYSTTTSSEKYRKEKHLLQDLLEARKIHLRDDYEPWVAVDIVDRSMRDEIFTRAGTKTLPIVFIDDVYIGDYEKMLSLDTSGDLDKMLPLKQA